MKPANNLTAQNERVADEFRKLTMSFRNRGSEFPKALYALLAANAVDPMRSVMLFATSAEQGTNPIVGADGRVIAASRPGSDQGWNSTC